MNVSSPTSTTVYGKARLGLATSCTTWVSMFERKIPEGGLSAMQAAHTVPLRPCKNEAYGGRRRSRPRAAALLAATASSQSHCPGLHVPLVRRRRARAVSLHSTDDARTGARARDGDPHHCSTRLRTRPQTPYLTLQSPPPPPPPPHPP